MNSRYDQGVTAWVDDQQRGRVQAVYLRPIVWTNFPYVAHQTVLGDRMELLADRTYDDARQYWLIAEMNPHIAHPDDLVPGEVLYIPAHRL